MNEGKNNVPQIQNKLIEVLINEICKWNRLLNAMDS